MIGEQKNFKRASGIYSIDLNLFVKDIFLLVKAHFNSIRIVLVAFLNIYLYFRLKCNERILHDEEIRSLRKEVRTSNDYRILIAKQEAEILV